MDPAEKIDKQSKYENIVWTIAEDYQKNVDINIMAKTGVEALDRLRMVILGKLYQDTNYSKILSYLGQRKHIEEGYFWELSALALEDMLLEELKTQYGGLPSLEKEGIHAVHLLYQKMRKRRDVFHEMRYSYYCEKMGLVPKTNQRVMKLIEDIHQFKEVSPENFIPLHEEILKKHFHFQSQVAIEEQTKEKVGSKYPREKSEPSKLQDERVKELDVHDEEVMAAEFSQVDIGAMEKEFEQDLADAPKEVLGHSRDYIFQKIIENYGHSDLSLYQQEQLQRQLAVGIHQDEKIHIASHFDQVKGYRKVLLEEAIDGNLDHFEYQRGIFRRNINRLATTLKQSILADIDLSDSKIRRGTLISSLAWRKEILGEEQVFFKRL